MNEEDKVPQEVVARAITILAERRGCQNLTTALAACGAEIRSLVECIEALSQASMEHEEAKA